MRKFVISVITDQTDENHNMISSPVYGTTPQEAIGIFVMQILENNMAIKSVKWVEV